MERPVTAADIAKYPELISMGVSINQNFDFGFLEQQEQSSPKQLAPDAPNNVHEHQYKAPAKQSTTNQEAKKEAPKQKVAPVKKVEKAPVKVAAKKVEKVVPAKKVAPKKAAKKGK